MHLVDSILSKAFNLLRQSSLRIRERQIRKTFSLPESVKLGQIENIRISGDVSVGEHTYVNSATIRSGSHASITIGEWCAIGYGVYILAVTHDPNRPTGAAGDRPKIESDIRIGNHVWIGNNVFIREGITIEDHAIIGANSVVTKDIPEGGVVGGVPAKLIRCRTTFN